VIIVDASLAAKWLFPEEEHSDLALALLAATLQTGEPVLAPPLLPSEVANTIRQRMRREGVPLDQALALLEAFFALPLTLTAPSLLSRRALILAVEHDLPAVYDAHYVALAEILGCDLWTDDRRLLRLVGGKLALVRWIGAYAPGSMDDGGGPS
jgi:predicted nucleic acid-binding protein